MKNIVICADGTGNSAIEGRGTNVFKLFEAVDVNGHRLVAPIPACAAYYVDGVALAVRRQRHAGTWYHRPPALATPRAADSAARL